MIRAAFTSTVTEVQISQYLVAELISTLQSPHTEAIKTKFRNTLEETFSSNDFKAELKKFRKFDADFYLKDPEKFIRQAVKHTLSGNNSWLAYAHIIKKIGSLLSSHLLMGHKTIITNRNSPTSSHEKYSRVHSRH